MKDFSFVTNSHPSYIEEVYKDFVKDPSTVDPEMKKFFEGVDFACNNGFASPSKPQHNIDANGTICKPVGLICKRSLGYIN